MDNEKQKEFFRMSIDAFLNSMLEQKASDEHLPRSAQAGCRTGGDIVPTGIRSYEQRLY